MCVYKAILPTEALHGNILLEYLDSGKDGEAYTTQDDHVLKITREKGEYLWVKQMIGHKCKHVVEVYDTWKYTLGDEELYFICEEKLNTEIIDYCTRTNVYNILNEVLCNIGRQQYRSRKELSMLLANDDNHLFETGARTIFKRYIDEEHILNSLLDAYMESLSINPRIELDLCAFNFGASDGDTIKVFDCILPEETVYRNQNEKLNPAITFNFISENT